jgi:hypothetical protein
MANEAFLMESGLAVAYTIVGGFVGVAMMAVAMRIIPGIVDKVTPNIDDEKEMLRGNLAVGTYVGLVTAAVILGLSVVVAAAIIAGLM